VPRLYFLSFPTRRSSDLALLGAGLLIMSRRRGGERLLLQLGGVTMVIVVARLLLVDLASVETIWRVFLFLLIGGVFLYAGYKLRSEEHTSELQSPDHLVC